MELTRLAAILWRRRWVLVVAVVIGGGACAAYLATREPTYEARVRIQLMPPREEEALATREPTVVRLQDTLDDLMTVTRNNFVEVLKSREVSRRVQARLGGRSQGCGYSVDVDVVRDSNFLDVVIRAPCRELVAGIANLLADEAIAYYVELRGLGLTATRAALQKARDSAAEALEAAESAFATFRSERVVGSISDAIRTSQEALVRLELERDRKAADTGVAGGRGPRDEDRWVTQWKRALAELIALEPAYRMLEERVDQARRNLKHVSDRSAEAELRSRVIQAASFMQRVEGAQAPERARSRAGALMVLAVGGSLGLGIAAVLLVDYFADTALSGEAEGQGAP